MVQWPVAFLQKAIDLRAHSWRDVRLQGGTQQPQERVINVTREYNARWREG